MRAITERTLGVLLYMIGIVLGLALVVGIVWANFEASMFDISLPAEERIGTLRCPALITADEVGRVTATFSNPAERPVQRTIRAHISDGFVSIYREIETRTLLEAGETQQLQWTITPEDAAWERFILVRIYVLRTFPLPSMTGTCGTIYVDLAGVSGQQLTAAIFVASLLSSGLGLWLWLSRSRPLQGRLRDTTQAMMGLAGLVLMGMVAALAGWWFVAGGVLVASALLLIVVFTWILSPR